MAIGPFGIAALISVAGSLLSGKIQSNRGQKAAIGSGTAPSVEPGAELNIAPVQGTEVQDFGAATEGFAEPEIDRVAQEQELMQQLIDAGYDPEELGIAGLAFGGPLYRSPGGGISDLYRFLKQKDPLDFAPRDLKAQRELQHIEDLAKRFTMESDPTLNRKIEPRTFEEYLNTSLDEPIELPPVEDPTLMSQMGEWWEEQDPLVQSTLVKVGTDFLREAIFPREQKGSLVSTQTLPGNSARRRAAQLNIKPIEGSVRKAAGGGVLDRPMFMPHGGAMHGRGGPKDDLIPVMASNGEYMLSKAAVDQAGDGSHPMGIARLEAFNKAGNRRYG